MKKVITRTSAARPRAADSGFSRLLRGLFRLKSPSLASKLQLVLSKPQPLTQEPGLVIGYAEDGNPITYTRQQIQSGIQLLGAAGSGKSVLARLLAYQQIQRGGGLLFAEGHSDSLQDLWAFCKLCGREKDLLIVNLWEPRNSHTYSPVLSGSAEEVAERVALVLPVPEGANETGVSYFRESGIAATGTIVQALKEAGLSFNLLDLAVLLTSIEALIDLRRKLQEHTGVRTKTEEYLSTLIVAAQRMGGSAFLRSKFGALAGRLFMLGTGRMAEVLNACSPEVNLQEAVANQKIVYLAMPRYEKVSTQELLARLLSDDLRRAVRMSPGAGRQFMVIADECTVDTQGMECPTVTLRQTALEASDEATKTPKHQVIFKLAMSTDEMAKVLAVDDEQVPVAERITADQVRSLRAGEAYVQRPGGGHVRITVPFAQVDQSLSDEIGQARAIRRTTTGLPSAGFDKETARYLSPSAASKSSATAPQAETANQ